MRIDIIRSAITTGHLVKVGQRLEHGGSSELILNTSEPVVIVIDGRKVILVIDLSREEPESQIRIVHYGEARTHMASCEIHLGKACSCGGVL